MTSAQTMKASELTVALVTTAAVTSSSVKLKQFVLFSDWLTDILAVDGDTRFPASVKKP